MNVLGEDIHEDECPCDGHKCRYDCKQCACSQEWKDADIRSAYQKELDERSSRGSNE